MDQKTTMENLARAAYEKGGFNGAWLYAEKGKIISKGAFGWVDAENTLPMREDSIFEMASVTKMFTATAVMLLVREGKLGLDDAYTKYFPEYPYEGVTIRHLLTHTSGMPDFDVEDLVGPVLEKENRIPANSEIIRLIRETGEEPVCAPGEAFEYSDVEAEVKGSILSVKNPRSGRICADSIGEIVRDGSVMETDCRIEVRTQ